MATSTEVWVGRFETSERAVHVVFTIFEYSADYDS